MIIDWLKQVGAGDWAGWIAVLVALGYGVYQIRSSREDTREATAINTWMQYYLRCIDHPEYANPELLKLDYKKSAERKRPSKIFGKNFSTEHQRKKARPQSVPPSRLTSSLPNALILKAVKGQSTWIAIF
jgi:hypothetical protein